MCQVTEAVGRLKDFFNIECQVQTKLFHSYKELNKSRRGVYVLTSDDGSVIYVGKGTFRDRLDSHWFKAHGTPKKSQIDPKGWKWLRENYAVAPGTWMINYIVLNKEQDLSAMEGGLIKLLQPLANDETFKDRLSKD